MIPLSCETGCNEAIPYLDFIIATYHHPMAEKYIFIHGHDTAWHCRPNSSCNLDHVYNSSYLRNTRYGGLCSLPWNSKTPPEPIFHSLYDFIYQGTTMPSRKVWMTTGIYPCCAQFFVESRLIRNRPLSDYIHIRDKLIEWSSNTRST
jgi:hypothetical protein